MNHSQRPSILIVDDTKLNIQLLMEILGRAYRISVAMDGQTALDRAEKILPDLILLDIMMPGMDGYEVCRRLKEKDATREIPVIFVTAMGEVEDEVRGFELGAVDYITKPVSPPRVLARVRTHLAMRDASRRLEAQNAQLIEAARLREDVDGILRHDLKTPLNSIIGLPSVIMAEADLAPEQVASLEAIEASGYRMLSMVNRSLDLMKMERGTYPFSPVAVDVVRVIGKIEKEIQAAPEFRNHQLVVRLKGEAVTGKSSFTIQGEELLCYSMLANLIKNAAEASPEGEPVFIDMDRRDGAAVETGSIRICNKGSIPEAIRDRFFDKYVTAGKSGGTGLGTYSARLIAETQQGEISLESSEDTGTAITVCLPLADVSPPDGARATDHAATAVTSEERESPLPRLTVLLVDDDPFNLQLLQTYLKDGRFATDTASDGKEGLEKIKTNTYDIVFMDMEMPILTGAEAVQRVRAFEASDGSGRKKIAAVALSAHDDPETEQTCLAAGFDGYLHKPVRKSDILRTLGRFFSPGRFSGEDAGAQPGLSSSGPEKDPVGSTNINRHVVEVDEDLEELIPAFLEKKRSELDELHGHLEKEDFERVRQLGHKLKGTCNMYGFSFLSDAFLALETAAADKDAVTIKERLAAAADFMDHMDIRYVEA